jgi:site-specific recombinase XerD
MTAEQKILTHEADLTDHRYLTWNLWIDLYCETWCVGRNLKVSTIDAYRQTLRQFAVWLARTHHVWEPGDVTTRLVLDYVVHLREQRKNGDSAIQRVVVVLKNLYCAIKAFGHIAPDENPMNGFPKMKKGRKKLPVHLSKKEVQRLLATPKTDTVLGLRDRAILTLLYATGIRAGECAGLIEEWVDLEERTIRVLGKGNRERVIRLNNQVVRALRVYQEARGPQSPREVFFRTKSKKPINRKVVYQRVRKHATLAGLTKHVTPHTLRHTCATHLVRQDFDIVIIRDLLGHRQITSTQIYLHTTAHDMQMVAANHPVGELAPTIANLLEGVRLPIDHPPRRRSHEKKLIAANTRASPTEIRTAP